MKIKFIQIKNFRKLKSCRIDFSAKKTIFVGANNSGKTSAMEALILFLKEKNKITTNDFTLSNWREINEIGKLWIGTTKIEASDLSIEKWNPYLPFIDVWLKIETNEIYYVKHLIPTLKWKGGLLGVRLKFEPEKIEELYENFVESYNAAKQTIENVNKNGKSVNIQLWPNSMRDFLESHLQKYFIIKAYILDPNRCISSDENIVQPQNLPDDCICLDVDPFKNLIKIDIIKAQRGFSDPNTSSDKDNNTTSGLLSAQFREYYSKHLDPTDFPEPEDIEALQSIQEAQSKFDEKIKDRFSTSLSELEELGYPGFDEPKITLSCKKIDFKERINHESAIQYDVIKHDESKSNSDHRLPEIYNGLGYQNLISMVFKLIRFRDEWMRVGKYGKKIIESKEEIMIEPLHLVLIEEPEAHLHAQVQQVFIRKAYNTLRNHNDLKNTNYFTQLVISTHSSHIAHEIDFKCLRYFHRKQPAGFGDVPSATVINLSSVFGSEEDETTKFAIRYLKTTHCDLFFADAAIIVEGPAERMLVPHFIKHKFPKLTCSYISLLEIGGSHAHRLRPLIEILGLITLIITDIDSVDPAKNNSSVLPKKKAKYKSGNSTLKTWLPAKDSLDELLNLQPNNKISKNQLVRVAYQFPFQIIFNSIDSAIIPYTFEDALVFENVELFKKISGVGLINKTKDALNEINSQIAREKMFKALKDGKKAEFALEVLFYAEPQNLKVPIYIKEGLEWLQEKLKIKQENIITDDTKAEVVKK